MAGCGGMNCPHCDRVVYSRKRGVCGYCGGELPAEMLFSAEEIAAMDAEKQAMERRRLAAHEEEKAEEENRGKRLRGVRRGLFGI